jgi:hydroxyisourate hydrolase
MTTVSTHVLDTAAGRPAAGLAVTLQRRGATEWTTLAATRTDADGRATGLAGADGTGPGLHRLVFDVGAYLSGAGGAEERPPFFPEVTVAFEIGEEPRLHVPLLLSRFGYTIYRGS